LLLFTTTGFSSNQLRYLRHYERLISRARLRTLNYSEKHHVIPKCLGGSDDANNLVHLTLEEHYVAHQLLVKIFPGNRSLIYAATMMTMGRKSNKHYGWLIRLKRQAMSEELHQRITDGRWHSPTEGKFGSDNPNFGKKRTPEQCKRISESLKGQKHPMFGRVGENNPNYGRHLSEEHKQKLRYTRTEEQKAKLRKPKSEEHKRKISEARMGQKRMTPVSEETRLKLSEAMKKVRHRQSQEAEKIKVL